MSKMRIYRQNDEASQTTYAKTCNSIIGAIFELYKIYQNISIQLQMKQNRCDKCDKGFMTTAALQKHVENHDNGLRDQMSDYVSGERYRSPANSFKKFKFNCTIFQTDERPPIHCTECGEQFANDDDLNGHSCVPVETTQGDKAKVECDQCGRSFRARTALAVNIERCTRSNMCAN